MEIKNTTQSPVRVLLPGGKRLHLGPAGKAKIAHKAVDHPPVKALIDAGTLEVVELGRSGKKSASKGGIGPSQDGSGGGGMRHTGDR